MAQLEEMAADLLAHLADVDCSVRLRPLADVDIESEIFDALRDTGSDNVTAVRLRFKRPGDNRLKAISLTA